MQYEDGPGAAICHLGSPHALGVEPPNTGSLPLRCLYTNHQPRWAGGRSTPDATAGTWSAQMGKKASQWCSGDSKKFMVLILWRFELGLRLNYLL
jgi:hypothetical protein